MRVFELAQSLATTSSDVLRHAGELGLDARSPLARLDEEEAKQLRSHFCRRSKEEIDRETEERRLKLSAKREADRLRRAAQTKSERELLLANIARSREIERTIKGLPDQTPLAPAPPSAAPVPLPGAVAAAVPTPAATPSTPLPAPAKPATPTAPTTAPKTAARKSVAPVPVAVTKPRPDKPRPKGPRRPGSEEEIDPDEALVAAYVGPQAVRPATRNIDKPRPGKESEAPRGSRLPPPRGTATRFVLAQRATAAVEPTASPNAGEPGTDHILTVRGPVVVKELAEMLGLRPNRLIADLMQLNVLASINQRVEIELANRIASKYGYTVELERARRSTERKPVLRRDDADDAIPDDRPDRKSTRLNSSHFVPSRMPSSA